VLQFPVSAYIVIMYPNQAIATKAARGDKLEIPDKIKNLCLVNVVPYFM
jgi:hypothetical protein